MKEIGSEFWSVPTTDRENALFPKNVQWYLSGRSALRAILRELPNCRTAALPAWCCDSMIKPFLQAGMTVRFYPACAVAKGLRQKLAFDCDVLLVMDYFGYSGTQPDLTGCQGKVIRDVTHSLFSQTYSDADYSFGSLRKWCGVYTGGFAWARNGTKLHAGSPDGSGYAEIRKEAMSYKSRYLSGEAKEKGYLAVFEEAEELLERVGIAPAEERDVRLAQCLDTEQIRSRRQENAAILMGAFRDWLIFPHLSETDCPLFVPILVPDGKRDALRRYLIKREIYCPVHWPVSDLHHVDAETKKIYENELSLICDQRYQKKDMLRIAEAVQAFWEE